MIFRNPELLPFLPLQILWINLITDSFPALALSCCVKKGESSHKIVAMTVELAAQEVSGDTTIDEDKR